MFIEEATRCESSTEGKKAIKVDLLEKIKISEVIKVLLKYNVSNFKSIGHNIEFSMFPTTSDIDERYTKEIQTKAGVWKVLKRSAFYGPNASGKSSFIESIDYARDFIVDGIPSGRRTGVNQFKGEFEDLDQQSVFQFTFLAEDNEIYEYGFSLDSKQVYEEWLMILTKNGFEPLFERQTDAEEKTIIEITAKLARKKSKNRELAELLKETIKEKQKNQLFLYKLYDNGIKRVEPVMEWFRSIQVIFPNTKVRFLPIRISTDMDFQKFISDSLSKMDTGVLQVSAVSDELDFHDFAEKAHFPKELIQDIEEKKQGMFSIGGKYYIFGEKQENRMRLIQIKFEHRLNSKSVEFDLEDESDGTQRLLDLLPMLFAIDKRNRSIYLVDEIDRSLHTKLSRYLLKLFLENSNDANCQIIYTAHDVNLIDMNEFSQDEIWFVEKKLTGETTIKPMSDFDVKGDKDILKAYLNGRFGAVPVIKGV